MNFVCFGEDALPPSCPSNTTFAMGGNESNACHCDWLPANGFDGFASSIALLSLGYALLLALAICANVRNPPLAVAPLEPAIEPLRASTREPVVN